MAITGRAWQQAGLENEALASEALGVTDPHLRAQMQKARAELVGTEEAKHALLDTIHDTFKIANVLRKKVSPEAYTRVIDKMTRSLQAQGFTKGEIVALYDRALGNWIYKHGGHQARIGWASELDPAKLSQPFGETETGFYGSGASSGWWDKLRAIPWFAFRSPSVVEDFGP